MMTIIIIVIIIIIVMIAIVIVILMILNFINMFHKYFGRSGLILKYFCLDSDGAVITGEGGVYGWIEEKREKLESLLGLDLFIKGLLS